MALVVREDLSVSIPTEMAEEFGIHKGSHVQWERTDDGRLTLRPATSKQEAARRLRGMFKGTLKPGDSAVADLIQEREKAALKEETA